MYLLCQEGRQGAPCACGPPAPDLAARTRRRAARARAARVRPGALHSVRRMPAMLRAGVDGACTSYARRSLAARSRTGMPGAAASAHVPPSALSRSCNRLPQGIPERRGRAERRARAGPVQLLLVGMAAISERRTEIRRLAFLATHIVSLLEGARARTPRASQALRPCRAACLHLMFVLRLAELNKHAQALVIFRFLSARWISHVAQVGDRARCGGRGGRLAGRARGRGRRARDGQREAAAHCALRCKRAGGCEAPAACADARTRGAGRGGGDAARGSGRVGGGRRGGGRAPGAAARPDAQVLGAGRPGCGAAGAARVRAPVQRAAPVSVGQPGRAPPPGGRARRSGGCMGDAAVGRREPTPARRAKGACVPCLARRFAGARASLPGRAGRQG